jgi:hypothetical protein
MISGPKQQRSRQVKNFAAYTKSQPRKYGTGYISFSPETFSKGTLSGITKNRFICPGISSAASAVLRIAFAVSEITAALAAAFAAVASAAPAVPFAG